MQTKLQTLDGVAEAQLMGGRSFSMRVWIDQNRLAGYGLVVDDAIVMVENVSRHIEAGLPPAEAARVGAREIALPIISMTLTLAAVYSPIGFIGGLTGTLFREFAFTLAAAVVISGVVALVLSPMMCSRVLRPESGRGLEAFSERLFGGLQEFYERRLRNSLKYRPSVLILVVAVLSAIPYLWLTSKSKLAPVEDKGSLIFTGSAPNRARSKPYWPFFRSRLLPWLCLLQMRP